MESNNPTAALASCLSGLVWSNRTGLQGGANPFRDCIPGYVDHFKYAHGLKSGLQQDNGLNFVVASLIGMPGIGKTATVREAARQAGAVYLNLSLKGGAMQTIIAAMKEAAPANNSTGKVLRDDMSRIAEKGLSLIFGNVAKEDITEGYTSIDENILVRGVEQGCRSPGWHGCSTALLEMEAKLQPNQQVVFHVDDAEVLAPHELIDLKLFEDLPATSEIGSALVLPALLDLARPNDNALNELKENLTHR